MAKKIEVTTAEGKIKTQEQGWQQLLFEDVFRYLYLFFCVVLIVLSLSTIKSMGPAPTPPNIYLSMFLVFLIQVYVEYWLYKQIWYTNRIEVTEIETSDLRAEGDRMRLTLNVTLYNPTWSRLSLLVKSYVDQKFLFREKVRIEGNGLKSVSGEIKVKKGRHIVRVVVGRKFWEREVIA